MLHNTIPDYVEHVQHEASLLLLFMHDLVTLMKDFPVDMYSLAHSFQDCIGQPELL